MQDKRLIVKYVPVKDSFVLVPSPWHRKLSSQAGAIKVSHEGKDFYFAPSQSQSSPGDFLCINATFGKCLQIKEGTEVNVSYVPDPPALTNIQVQTVNVEDWHIVNLKSHKIETTLLDQVGIVSLDQPIVVWLSKYLNVTLLVESISPPFRYGKIENHTEVVVRSVSVDKTSGDSQKKIPRNSRPKKCETDCEILMKNWRCPKLPEIFRICLVSLDEKYRVNGIPETEISSPHNIFMFSSRLRELFPERKNFSMIYGRIKRVFKEKQSSNLPVSLTNQRNSDNEPEMVVSLSPVEHFLNKQFIGSNGDDKNIWLSEGLRRYSRLPLGTKVHIEPLENVDNIVTSLGILSSGDFDEKTLENNFKDYVHQYSTKNDLIISQNTRISLGDRKCRIKLRPDDIPHVLLNDEKLRTIKIEIIREGNTQVNEETLEDNLPPQEVYETPLKKILEDSVRMLTMSLTPQDYSFPRQNILICGSTGTGKTTLLHHLQQKMENPPNFMNTIFVDCRKLKGKKVDAVSKIFTSTMHDCVYYQPSVLFLDNLDSITSRPSDNEEDSPDATNATRISESLSSLFTIYQSSHLISIVASSTRMERLGVGLRPSRGVHVFQTMMNVPSLSAEERIDFLKFKLRGKVEISEKNFNWEFYSGKTEGWVFQDLSDLSEKSVFIAWKRGRAPVVLEDEDLSKALGMIKPLSLYGVSLFSGEGNSWGDIGGLEGVKESLRQILQWPLMYPGLFAKAPVRHQSGILLYGMPGTGKTMLAGAIAKECGLNFINIKGPELLSRYIGASEEAVRSIFEKAQRIRPCIVFFDEFESLAPRSLISWIKSLINVIVITLVPGEATTPPV
ncbi:uncharacterized protein LOC135171180 isoform X2 [Diachasmimorpha longicaudata]|uniref:uncharacterized protein LOC135171180 isoform X2 n=1 Tax=Diachasmimorpha longicaudata TaxID=58733 RepID=UPI0030B8699C